ncbi:MAG: leucine-rich repeat domain-containing protein [Holosporales bacterium]|jgi:hypothetical protein|nr:leucine-rich repeat domain-containing protein [Holosporales bacterium]
MCEINFQTDAHSAGCVRKVLCAGKAQIASIRKNHSLIKHAAYLIGVLAITPQLHSSLESPLARIGAAQECIASNSAIIKAVNTPLYTNLGNNFDCIHEHLEIAKQEIIAWRNELCSRFPELLPELLPEFYAYLSENNTTVAELSSQPLTRVLIDVYDTSDVGTDIETLFLVKNYTPAGFNFANYVNLKVIAMFDGTMTDSLRTAIQNLAKQQNKLECIIVPSWGTTVESNAFHSCTSLQCCKFGTVTSILAKAFRSCSALANMDCPLVTSVGEEAFLYCYAFGHANFGQLTSIEYAGFMDSKELINLSKMSNLTSLPDRCFYGCGKLCTIGEILNEVNLNITSIGPDAFRECYCLLKVTLPNITSIPSITFSRCNELVSVNCPLVTRIQSNAFEYCSSLQSCTFGHLTSIESNAFIGCYSLNPIPSIG